MRALLLALAFTGAGCTTMGADDPILGCWRRDGDDIALVFEQFGQARQQSRETHAIEYIFADLTWRRTADGYVLRYQWPHHQRPTTTETARLVGGQLVFEDNVGPYQRVTLTQCGQP
jgi:hypothetical protein